MSLSSRLSGLRTMLAFDGAWRLILGRLLGVPVLTYRKGDVRLRVDRRADDAAGLVPLTSTMYSQFYPRLGRRKKARLDVLDLGANIGAFPLALHLAGFHIQRLCSVEFNPATFQRLTSNMDANLATLGFAWTGLCVAVSSRRETLSLPLGNGGTGDSICWDNGDYIGQPLRLVACWTLDEVATRAFPEGDVISLCKIDVEGSEYDIFLASEAHQSIRRCAYVLTEIHPHPVHEPSDILGALARCDLFPVAVDAKRRVYLFENKALL